MFHLLWSIARNAFDCTQRLTIRTVALVVQFDFRPALGICLPMKSIGASDNNRIRFVEPINYQTARPGNEVRYIASGSAWVLICGIEVRLKWVDYGYFLLNDLRSGGLSSAVD